MNLVPNEKWIFEWSCTATQYFPDGLGISRARPLRVVVEATNYTEAHAKVSNVLQKLVDEE